MTSPVSPGGLRRLLSRPAPQPAADEPGPERATQRCDLCTEPVPSEHRHLVDTTDRGLRCACRACGLLFDRSSGDGTRYRLVPDRRWHLAGFSLDDAAWARLRIPVSTAFFFRDSAVGRVVAFYPSPAGAVESLLELADWTRLAAANPVLGRLVADVEALLVHGTPAGRDHWLVPIDDCYALVGLIRTRWTGLAGGPGVWHDIDAFFARLRARARPLPAAGVALDQHDPTEQGSYR